MPLMCVTRRRTHVPAELRCLESSGVPFPEGNHSRHVRTLARLTDLNPLAWYSASVCVCVCVGRGGGGGGGGG